MPEAPPCDEWKARPLYWSTIGYLRWWWAADGPRLRAIEARGELTAPMLRDLASEYRVNRSLLRADKKKGAIDTNAIAVCAILNRARDGWGDGLPARAAACHELAEAMKPYTAAEAKDHKYPISAATKFMWFLKPAGWTVFDRLAGNGMGLPESWPPKKRMQAFYDALQDKGFTPLVAEMQAVIDGFLAFASMPATRVLDTLFMARGHGGAGSEEGLARIKAFHALLPEAVREDLERLATDRHTRFSDRELTRGNRPARVKTKK